MAILPNRIRSSLTLITVAAACLLAAACSAPDAGDQAGTETPAAKAVEEQAPVADTANAQGTRPLAGTSWQLVKIMSMDDRTDVPADPSLYTLAFNADGSASMLADCNRGSASWQSEGSGQLSFGPVAATRAMCPPESISGTYLAQFEWVRSYVMKDGHLFLSTMADGSIIEFAPDGTGSPVATVLGEDVDADDPDQVQEIILTRLFDRYADEHGISVNDAELDAYVEKMRSESDPADSASEQEPSAEEAVEVANFRDEMGRSLIRQWKLNKALHEQYGGRLIYQQFGPEPLDAYRQFLEEQQAAGAFVFDDPVAEQVFWKYFRDDSMHEFMASGSEDEAKAFAVPPWE